MNILINSPFDTISKEIKAIREKKGSEKDALNWIEEAINFGKGFIANLYFERILAYQHMIMNGDKTALPKMEAATLVAQKYVKENNLKMWESRAYRFLGRLYDYKNQPQKSIVAYKKAISKVKLDPEPFRELELEGFLSYAFITAGKKKEGINLSQKVFDKFNKSKDGITLKKKDYDTWAIWKSGIVIRTLGATLDRKLAKLWIKEIEEDLSKGDFSYRKAELQLLIKKFEKLN